MRLKTFGKSMSKNFLLDTHALLFWANEELSAEFNSFLNVNQRLGLIWVSPISFWEVSLKVQKGKLEINDVENWGGELMQKINLKILQPTWIEMIQSTRLDPHHKDPFDRLLIAQALSKKMTLLTKDSEIKKYSILTLWMD